VPPLDVDEKLATRQADRLRVLAESTHVFAEASNQVDRLLRLVAQRFAEVIGDGCYIRLVGADGVSLEPVATYHPVPEVQRFLRETVEVVPLKVGEGISGRVVETGEAVLLPEVPLEQFKKMTKPEFLVTYEQLGISSILAVCLRARGAHLGFITLVRNGVGRPSYTQEDLSLMQDLADRAALAIDNARLLEDLERRVEERTRALESANRELEAFSYSVSHDLRAPLRAIDGFSQILVEDHALKLDEDGRKVVGVIRRNTRKMGQLIDDLLRFSQLGRQALRMSRVDMRALAGTTADELVAAASPRTVELRLGELPPADCDPDLIRQVWTNLLANAIKYTGGKPIATVDVAGAVEGDELRYSVQDNGAGFDPQYSDQLFRVFQRLHRSEEFEGTGIGLALVARIVARHGGRVWAEGRLGEGASFGFALPRRPPAT